jgi:hypothetical protein
MTSHFRRSCPPRSPRAAGKHWHGRAQQGTKQEGRKRGTEKEASKSAMHWPLFAAKRAGSGFTPRVRLCLLFAVPCIVYAECERLWRSAADDVLSVLQRESCLPRRQSVDSMPELQQHTGSQQFLSDAVFRMRMPAGISTRITLHSVPEMLHVSHK